MTCGTNTEKNKAGQFLDRYPAIRIVMVFIFCYFFNCLFNRDLEIKSLYMDDLANYYYYIRNNFWEYAFGVAENQINYRPLFYSLTYLICSVITGHLERITLINGLIQSTIGTLIYCMLEKFKVNKLLALTVSALFLATHLSCFQMGQMIGPIESVSMFFSLLILYKSIAFLYYDSNDSKKRKIDRIVILTAFFLVNMTHERFIGLIVPIIITFLSNKVNRKEKQINLILALGVFAVILIIRAGMLHTVIPAGTSGTKVTDSFSARQAIKFAIDQVLFVLGFNAGPQYLTGIEHYWVAPGIKILIYTGAAIWVVTFIVYVIIKIRRCDIAKNCISYEPDIYKNDIRIDLIMVSSVVMYILSSSLTIRLEMRWIYISFAAALIYSAYMFTYIWKASGLNARGWKYKLIPVVCLLYFFAARFTVEAYYHKYYYNIFFFWDLIATNSLAENTVYKYSEEELTEDGKVYILSNEFQLSESIYKYFYEPFYGHRRNGDGRVIEYIPDMVDEIANQRGCQRDGNGEISQIDRDLIQGELLNSLIESGKAIILKEDMQTRTYIPISGIEK